MAAAIYSAEEVTALRKALAMTQEQFAQRIAVTVSTVNRWERHHSRPSQLATLRLDELRRTLPG